MSSVRKLIEKYEKWPKWKQFLLLILFILVAPIIWILNKWNDR